MTGIMVYGHEVRTVRLCNQTQVHWLQAPPEIHKDLQETSGQSSLQPYQELYLDFTGRLAAESKGEFAKSYDGSIEIMQINEISTDIPDHCK